MSDVSNGKEQTAASGPRSGYEEDADERSGLLQLAILSLAAGAVIGLVVALFRLCLDRADHFRHVLVAWGLQWGILGFVLAFAVCALATAVAAWMVRRWSPHASGGGIAHVEKVLSSESPPATLSLFPVKFAGGVLASGSGLAL